MDNTKFGRIANVGMGTSPQNWFNGGSIPPAASNGDTSIAQV